MTIRKYIELLETAEKEQNKFSGNRILTKFIKNNKPLATRLNLQYVAENIIEIEIIYGAGHSTSDKNVSDITALVDTIKQYGVYDEVAYDYDGSTNTYVITVVHDEVQPELSDVKL